jgi:hypothetical protein
LSHGLDPDVKRAGIHAFTGLIPTLSLRIADLFESEEERIRVVSEVVSQMKNPDNHLYTDMLVLKRQVWLMLGTS